MNSKIFGKIKWFKAKKNYGYIIGIDEEKYFFESIDCIKKDEKFNEGDLVLFEPNFGLVQYASNIEKINKG